MFLLIEMKNVCENLIKKAGNTPLFFIQQFRYWSMVCSFIIYLFIIGRCIQKIDDNGNICGQELHLHLKPNRVYIKKIRNRCEHVGEVNRGRMKDLEGIAFKTDKQNKKGKKKGGGNK